MEETKTDYALMKETEQNKRALLREDKCDKYDYLAAVACGAVGGLVDIFLVGTPGNSVLGKWTDSQVDSAVKGFAKLVGWNPRQAQKENVASAIGFLERKYKVNYRSPLLRLIGTFNLPQNAFCGGYLVGAHNEQRVAGIKYGVGEQYLQ